MKIEKITDAFVNEFDGEAQSCRNDCTEYFGKTEGQVSWLKKCKLTLTNGQDSRGHHVRALEFGSTSCYWDKTPKACIYW